MDWQQLVSLIIVATAGALMARTKLRRGRSHFGCDTHCGCVMPGAHRDRLVFRARKGGRAEVLVKMK